MVSQEQLRDSLVVGDHSSMVTLKSFLEHWDFSSHCIKTKMSNIITSVNRR